MEIAEYQFEFVCNIKPVVDDNGQIVRYQPQQRYKNLRNLPLNKYGSGPFCKFKIPSKLTLRGVYIITVNDEVKYIGECVNLSDRYNMGYGNISPRNCFKGGQETNCRINTLIYIEAAKVNKIELWFYETTQYKPVEHELRQLQISEWNRV